MRSWVMVLASCPLASGCVMAVRHVAHEANRSDAETRAAREFPVGDTPAQIRDAMATKGYACTDLPVTDPRAFRLSCSVLHPRKTAGTFLVGGNWRLEFAGIDGRLVHVHASAKKRPGGSAKVEQL